MCVESVLCQGQAKTIEAGVQAWKAEARVASAVVGLERLLGAAQQLGRALKVMQDRRWAELRGPDKDFPVHQTGLELSDCYESALRAFEAVEACVQQAERAGSKVDGAADFRVARDETRRLRDQFRKRWPLLDLVELQAANARADRGEVVSLEDFLREVALESAQDEP